MWQVKEVCGYVLEIIRIGNTFEVQTKQMIENNRLRLIEYIYEI